MSPALNKTLLFCRSQTNLNESQCARRWKCRSGFLGVRRQGENEPKETIMKEKGETTRHCQEEMVSKHETEADVGGRWEPWWEKAMEGVRRHRRNTWENKRKGSRGGQRTKINKKQTRKKKKELTTKASEKQTSELRKRTRGESVWTVHPFDHLWPGLPLQIHSLSG